MDEWKSISSRAAARRFMMLLMTGNYLLRHAPFFPHSPMTRDGELFLPAIMFPVADFETALTGPPDDFDLPPAAPRDHLFAALSLSTRSSCLATESRVT